MNRNKRKTQKEIDAWMASGNGRRLHIEGGMYICRNGKPGANTFSWAYIYMTNGKRKEAGLGPYDERPLESIRRSANAYAERRREGEDIITERRAVKKAAETDGKTFGEVADLYVKDVGSQIWKGGDKSESKKAFESVVRNYCAGLASTLVADVTVSDVKKVLEPWVKSRPAMVKVVASVIRRVIDTAFAHEFRPLGVNPASEDILAKVLPVRHRVKHHDSQPWKDAPAFYAGLGDKTKDDALRLLILTALRVSEVTGLLWDEVDLETCTLRIDAARMKGKRDHIVPLSRQACEILKARHGQGHRGKFVFPSPHKANQPISRSIFGITVHGFRATFRTWAEDHDIDANLAEHALAHALPDGVQKAYRRSTAVELRQAVMQQYADHVAKG